MRPKPTVDEIKAYRVAQMCSLQEANKRLLTDWKSAVLTDLRLKTQHWSHSPTALSEVLVDIIDLLREDLSQ